jgi:uncharacterized protein YggE
MNIRSAATRLSLAFVALTVMTPAFLSAQTTAQPSAIVAQGESVVKAAPDQAWATVAVETREAKAPEARRLAAVAMTSVMAALKTAGLPADAIKTIGFSLNPDYEYVNGRQRMRGFVVSNQVQVRIDDVAKVADVLDAVGGLALATSSTLTIANLRFDLKNRAQLERDALRLAVEDALANAKAMAAGAAVTLGRIARIDQTGGSPKYQEMQQPMMAMAARDGGAVSTPISPSEIEIRSAVMLTVEIK